MPSETVGKAPGALSIESVSSPAFARSRARTHEPDPNAADMARAITVMVSRLIDSFDLNASDLAATLGVSESFMSKLRWERVMLAADSHPYQNAVLLVCALEALHSLLGIRASVKSYLYEPHETLCGRPIKLMRSPEGLVDVTRYVGGYDKSRRSLMGYIGLHIAVQCGAQQRM